MESNFETKQERAILVGLDADCFRADQTATDETIEELEALLETAGGLQKGFQLFDGFVSCGLVCAEAIRIQTHKNGSFLLCFKIGFHSSSILHFLKVIIPQAEPWGQQKYKKIRTTGNRSADFGLTSGRNAC